MAIDSQGAPPQEAEAPPHPEPRRLPLARRIRQGLGVGQSPASRFRHLRESVARRYPQADMAVLQGVFEFADEAHRGQMRVSGEPYINHPLAAAQILADLEIDPVAIEAALLHDVPEDSDFTLQDVEDRFGTELAQLVDGVTKLSRFSTHSHEEQQAENIRKMFLAMAEDIRVVLIKLADRLHNMRTLSALPVEKQMRIARQTMEIYAPLAERLGIWSVKWELEDLAFKTLEPDSYDELARMLDTRRKAREAFIQRAMFSGVSGTFAMTYLLGSRLV